MNKELATKLLTAHDALQEQFASGRQFADAHEEEALGRAYNALCNVIFTIKRTAAETA